MSNEQLQEIEQLKKKGVIKPGKMMSLGDIVCDIRVSELFISNGVTELEYQGRF